MKPYFSIIIPTLNEAEYITRLLSSLEGQTYNMFEVIIVDGNSEDETVVKAKAFTHRLPHIEILHADKRNVGHQRNKGAYAAQGMYLIFFDADVIIPQHFLYDLQIQIEKTRCELATTYIETQKKDFFHRCLIIMTNIGLDVFKLLKIPTAGGYNIIIHQSLFKKIQGFNEDIIYGEDFDLIRVCQTNGIVLTIFHSPRLIFSFRRFDRLGYMRGIKEFIQGTWYAIFYGPIKKPLFDYPMGGEIYKKNQK